MDKFDILKLANAVVNTSIRYSVTHGRNAYNECKHCHADCYWDRDPNTIQHDINCVFLLAQRTVKEIF